MCVLPTQDIPAVHLAAVPRPSHRARSSFPRAWPTTMRSYLWSLGRLRQAVWLFTVVVLIFFLSTLLSSTKEPNTKPTR